MPRGVKRRRHCKTLSDAFRNYIRCIRHLRHCKTLSATIYWSRVHEALVDTFTATSKSVREAAEELIDDNCDVGDVGDTE